MRECGVGVLGRRPTDVAAQDDERRPLLLGDSRAESRLERVDVVRRLAELHHVPAVRLEALRDVVAVRELGRPVDRDVVVVVDVDEAAEPEVPGERRGLVTDALFEVAVAADREHVVIAHLRSEPLAQVGLGDRHADAVGEALAQRTGRHLDAAGVQPLRVARRVRPPLAEVAQVVELEPEAAQVEHRVQQHRRVAGGENETVAVGPVGVARRVVHDPGEEHVRERSEGHRSAGVAVVRTLHRVHREPADDVDGPLFQLGFAHKQSLPESPPTLNGGGWRERSRGAAVAISRTARGWR